MMWKGKESSSSGPFRLTASNGQFGSDSLTSAAAGASSGPIAACLGQKHVDLMRVACGVAACVVAGSLSLLAVGCIRTGQPLQWSLLDRLSLPRRVKIQGVSDALAAVQDEQDPTRRYHAYLYLGDPGLYDDEQTEQEVVQLLSVALKVERVEQNRVAIIESLGRLGSTAAIPALSDTARDPSATIRAAACAALGQIGTAAVIPLLEERFTTDDSLDVRLAAAAALSNVGERSAAIVLLQGLTDPDIAVVYCCRKSLEQLLGQNYGNDLEAWRQAVREAEFVAPPRRPLLDLWPF